MQRLLTNVSLPFISSTFHADIRMQHPLNQSDEPLPMSWLTGFVSLALGSIPLSLNA